VTWLWPWVAAERQREKEATELAGRIYEERRYAGDPPPQGSDGARGGGGASRGSGVCGARRKVVRARRPGGLAGGGGGGGPGDHGGGKPVRWKARRPLPREAPHALASHGIPAASDMHPSPAEGIMAPSGRARQAMTAARTDPAAAHRLAGWYREGKEGVYQSLELAFRWELRAAERGHVVAQFNAGCRYTNGDGVDVDHAAAATWWEAAAEGGHPVAQFKSGLASAADKGTPQHYELAVVLTLVHFSAQPKPFWSVSRLVSSL